MKNMSLAPRDGREINAFHKDGKCFHKVLWDKDHWTMKHFPSYYCSDLFYNGFEEVPHISRP